jgi:DNA repair protein RecO (recombination protein O)
MLTAEEGITRATVFGGPKSKLRSHAAPYNSGQVWIYRSSKDYAKLSDFDVHSWRPGLRELYERTMAAGGVAETVLSTHGGGGDWGEALRLTAAALDALENAKEEMCGLYLIHFLWRWAGFLGLQPHIDSCAACGDRTADTPLWYSAKEGTAFCAGCVPAGDEFCPQESALSPKSSSVPKNQALSPNLLQINPGCRRWLAAVGQLEPALLNRYSMDNKSFHEAKALAAAVLTAALGKRLSSWDF